jgi:hypothetical protein
MNKTAKLCSTGNCTCMQLLKTRLVKKIPAFTNSEFLLLLFKRARHWILSWTRWLQPVPSNIISLRCILILFSHLCLDLPSGLIPSAITAKMLYVPDFSSMHVICLYCFTHLERIFGEVFTLWRSSLGSWLYLSPTSLLSTPSFGVFSIGWDQVSHSYRAQFCILSRVWVTTDGVWIGDSIYWPLTDRNYKWLWRRH